MRGLATAREPGPSEGALWRMQRYLVFGRRKYTDPLARQGVLEAGDPEQARRQALESYGKEWVELTLIPEKEIHWVLQEAADRKEGAEAVVANG